MQHSHRPLSATEKKIFLHELTTILDVLRWLITTFTQYDLHFGHGTDNALDEAAWLLSFALHIEHTDLDKFLPAKLTQAELNMLWEIILARVNDRKPLAYIFQKAIYQNIIFHVDTHVLIPRSPIAELIHNNFQPWLMTEPQSILDLCTGSGCLACLLAMQFPEATVDATDISPAALHIAELNIQELGLTNVHLIKSDLWQNLANNQYDLIVTNPPYVATKSVSALPAEYRYEPNLALHAGTDGLDYIEHILQNAGNFLHENGILILEVGEARAALLHKYPNVPFTWIEFASGGDGVLVLSYQELNNNQYFHADTHHSN